MKKLITICLLCALIFSLGAVIFMQNDNQTTANAESGPYTLYPNPQQITFGSTNCTIPRKVSVSFGSGLDTYTVDRGYLALSKMDLVAYANREDLSYKFYFGVYGSNDTADNYVKTNNITIPEGLFDKIDAYLLVVDTTATVVLGKDTDATFYGLSTLSLIFEQTSNNKVRHLTVYDYSDSIYRGFIEGYYGIPWTTDERVELMEFAGQFKANIYIYAPKDDPYHSTNWRGLYTDTDLEEIKEQVEAGKRNKVRFTWSIHPLLQKPLKESTYDADLQVLLAKFEQLYQAGVRSFMVSADDISTGWTEDNPAPKYDATFQKHLLNDVAEWLRQKGDCHNLIFVPSAYNSISGESVHLDKEFYFETLMGSGDDVLDPTVEVMWTGARVCASVSNGTFDDFANLTGGRKAFMWMNWPVNDYLPNTILMSKGEVYDVKTDANGEVPFTGIVTNPMQYAEASKVGIFATIDYCWNVDAFNVDKSYQDSFKYIEGNCANELYNISSHIANAGKFEEKYFDESWSLTDTISAFWTAYNNDDYANAKAHATTLKGLFEDIVADVDSYLVNAQNQKLVANLRPFAESLRYKSLATINYLDVYVNRETMDKDAVSQLLQNAKDNINNANNCCTHTLNTVTYNHDLTPVSTCVAVINPFLEEFEQCTSGIVYRGFDGMYQGSVSNVMDGDDQTYAWFSGRPTASSYVRIDLGETLQVTDITVLSGLLENGAYKDTWSGGVVSYSTDDVNYTTLGNIQSEQSVFVCGEPVAIRYVKVSGASSAWAALREVKLNSLTVLPQVSGLELEPQSALPAGVINNLANVIDDDINSLAWFKPNSQSGSYIQLAFAEAQTINSIRLLMTRATTSLNDYLPNVTLSYSMDGVEFTPVNSAINSTEFFITLEQPITAKYLRATSGSNTTSGVIIRDFSINKEPLPVTYYGFERIYQGSVSNVIDANADSFLWFGSAPIANESYVTIDLGEITTLKDIKILNGRISGGALGDFWKADVLYSTDGIDFTTLGVLDGLEETLLDIRDNPVSARYIRIKDNGQTTSWVGLRDVMVNTLPDLLATVSYGNIQLEPSVTTSAHNLNDGDLDTFTWFGTNNQENAYVQLNFVEPQTINQIQLLMAKPTSIDDYFRSYQLSYSTDGEQFVNVGEAQTLRSLMLTLDTPLQNVKVLRVTSTATTANGVVIRDFSINNNYAISYGDGFKPYDYVRSDYPLTHVSLATDGNADTFLDLEKASGTNRTVTLDLFEVKTISTINVITSHSSDKIETCTVEYSANGTEWTAVTDAFTIENGDFTINLATGVEARYVRLNIGGTGWIGLCEFSAS